MHCWFKRLLLSAVFACLSHSLIKKENNVAEDEDKAQGGNFLHCPSIKQEMMSQSLKVLSQIFQASQNWTFIQVPLGRRDNCFLFSICQLYLSFTPGEGLHGKICFYAMPSRSLKKLNWEKGRGGVIPNYTRHCVNYKPFQAGEEKKHSEMLQKMGYYRINLNKKTSFQNQQCYGCMWKTL